MARGAILIPLIFLSMGTSAPGAEIAWQGTLTIDFVALPPLQVEGVGVATLDGPGIALDTLRFDGGITGSAATPFPNAPDPSFSLSLGAKITLGAGTLGPFWPPQPLTANTLPLRGAVKICVIVSGCGLYIGLPLSAYFGQVGIGVGGMLTVGHGGPMRISVDAAPWTVGTASVSLPTPSGDVIDFATRGWAHGPASFAGSTALIGGELSVVTPIQVTSNSQGKHLTSIARLHVRFVPEPRRWVSIVAGAAGLALLGKSRRYRARTTTTEVTQ